MSRIRDEIDHLTACLTTSSDALPDVTSGPEILVLLLGHLPVRSGLWRLPAARVLLPDADSIVVARVDKDQLVLERIGGDIEQSRSDDDPDAMLQQLGTGGGLVLVPGADANPEAIAAIEADRYALITGADQAAMVGAYRMIKRLALPPAVAIELIIAGESQPKAEEISTRLAESAASHLGRTVSARGAIPTIDADTGLSRSLGVDRPAGGLLEIAQRVRRGLSAVSRSVDVRGPGVEGRVMSSPESPGPVLPMPPLLQPLEANGSPSLEPVGEQAPCVRLSPSPSPVQADPVPTPCLQTISAGSEAPPSVASSSSSDIPLCSHMPGLQLLDFRCPDHEAAELALDGDGRLHILVQGESVSAVPLVQGWVRRHRSLLEVALPDARHEDLADTWVHVLTGDARLLMELRETGWDLRLIGRVQPECPPGWWSMSLKPD